VAVSCGLDRLRGFSKYPAAVSRLLEFTSMPSEHPKTAKFQKCPTVNAVELL